MKENVSFFNIASEASYVYKLMKNAKISLVDLWLKKLVLPERSISIGQKLMKNAKM